MESDSGKFDGLPNWRTIFQAAVLERDSSQALERITQAEKAIMFRLEALRGRSNDASEGEFLANALTVLQHLRKVNDSQSQGAK